MNGNSVTRSYKLVFLFFESHDLLFFGLSGWELGNLPTHGLSVIDNVNDR